MLTKDTNVWLQGGSWRLLGVQLLACLVTAAWAVVTTVIQLFLIEKTIGIRLTREEELQGCDFVEHGIGEETGDKEQGEEALQMESASAPDHLISSTDKRKDNEGLRNSNDLRSMCSMMWDVEELIEQELCYPMIKQKDTADKCVQVISEHGVLIEL